MISQSLAEREEREEEEKGGGLRFLVGRGTPINNITRLAAKRTLFQRVGTTLMSCSGCWFLLIIPC